MLFRFPWRSALTPPPLGDLITHPPQLLMWQRMSLTVSSLLPVWIYLDTYNRYQCMLSLSIYLATVSIIYLSLYLQPVTKKLHAIIERTAGFVAKQGTQMEIMIKAKQRHNPHFSFLSLYDPLYSYYHHILRSIASGRYSPPVQVEEGGGGREEGGEKEEVEKEEESDSEDSDDEGFELHPLLRVSRTPRSSPKPPETNTTAPSVSVGPRETPPTSSAPTSTQFLSKTMSVNAAPYLEEQWQLTSRYPRHTDYPPPSMER